MSIEGRRLMNFGTIAAVAFVVLATAMPSAHGSDAISIERDSSIIWIATSVGDDDGATVTVRIKAPRADRAGTWLYQRCSFSYSGPATYRCGIDDEAARQHPGSWKVRVDVDGARVAQRWFEVAE